MFLLNLANMVRGCERPGCWLPVSRTEMERTWNGPCWADALRIALINLDAVTSLSLQVAPTAMRKPACFDQSLSNPVADMAHAPA